MLDAHRLLAGPRGRRLCLELLLAAARDAATPGAEELTRAVFLAAHQLDPGSGSSRVMLTSSAEGLVLPEPTVPPDDVAALADASPPGDLDDRSLMESLAAAVDSARYWQEADGEDVLAAEPSVKRSLARIAAYVAASDRAAWWAGPLDRAGQWSVAFDQDGSPAPTVPVIAAERLARWRAETEAGEARARRDRPSDPTANMSGEWWSTPPNDLTRTTRSLDPAGPVGLHLVEDAWDWDSALVHPVEVPETLRVHEIDGPSAWAWLCGRFPMEVTASRRHDWFRTTGATGRWVVPDWSRVAEEVDAVHLTVAGYLETAGRAVAVTEDTASVLAGWDPDATYWLTDAPRAAAPARRWVREDQGWTERTR